MMPPSSTPLLPLPSSTLCHFLNSESRAYFLTIPVEIRNLIYTYVLEDEHAYPVPITKATTAEEDEADPECVIRGPYALPRVHGSTLLRVNRQVHDEVRDLMSRKRRICHDGASRNGVGTTHKCDITLQSEAYFYPVWTSIPSFLPFQLQPALPSTSTLTTPEESISLGTLPALNLTLHIRGDNQQRLPHSMMGPFYANGLDPPSPIWSLWLIIRDILTCGPTLQSNHKTTTTKKESNGVRIGILSLNVLTPPPASLPNSMGILPVEGFRELRGFRRPGVINPRTVAGEFVAYTEWLWEEGGYPDGDEMGKLFVERLDGFRVCVDGGVVKEWDVRKIRGRGRKTER